jgi:hypothetical protein
MNIHTNYMIMKPMQFPWLFVSPLDTKGLEFHLAPDLSICIEGIISGDQDFMISHIIMGVEQIEVNEIQAEQMFLTEFLPNKSKERISKAFKNEGISCFFSIKQMEYLQTLFTEKNFMSYSVSVTYRDKKVDDIALLPPKEFNLVSAAFDELDVHWSVSHKENKKEFVERYADGYEKKVAKLEDHSRKDLWGKIKNKNMMKRIGTSIGAIVLGIGGFIARSRLSSSGGAGGIIAGLILGTAGVILEMYGRQEAENTLRQLKVADRAERVAFN